MSTTPRGIKNGKYGTALSVRVIPGAKRTKIVGVGEDGTIKIHLAAQPIDGQANSALIDYLSDILDVPKSAVEIVAGFSRREKLISVVGVDPEIVEKKVLKLID